MTDEQPSRLFAEREHAELIRGLNQIHELARSIGHVATPLVADRMIDVMHWIDRTLEPHLAWEDAWLYPEIDRRTATPWATRAARFDHSQLRSRVERLRFERVGFTADLEGARDALQADLFAFEGLVRAHVEREEQFLLPLLDEPAMPDRDAAVAARA
jgi:hemerythrin-like domain-containing protein